MKLSGGARAALRIARRDAMRHKARSALVVVMIALPVLALTAADVLTRTMQLSTAERVTQNIGHAAARLTLVGGHVSQQPDGNGYGSDGSLPAPGTPAYAALQHRVRTLLPPGSRVIEDVDTNGPAGTGSRLVRYVEIVGLDLRDPMTVGMQRVVRGRAAADPTEVTVTESLARRLHLSPGSPLMVAQHPFTVVGIVHNPRAVNEDGVVMLPRAVPVQPDAGSVSYLVQTSEPVTWPSVRKLNAAGVVVQSRYVALHPPAGVPLADASTLASRARAIGIATVAVGLAVLEVVLLAGAAFAVGARRQRHDLALVAAVGGDEHDVRRVVLANGFVLGLAGAAVGVIAGVIAGKAAVPLAARWADRDAGHFDLRLLEIAAIALVGIATGVVAAILPARTAARDDVVAALTGRRGIVTTARRIPMIGVAMIVLGAVAAAYAAHPPARFTLVLAGAVIAEIGFVVCAPAVVGAAGRVAGVLPLTMRLSLRDASRHRGRTGPAVAAVLAAVAGSIAVSAWITSQVAADRQSYHPMLRLGQSAVQVYSDPSHPAPDAATIRAVLSKDLPVTGLTAMSTTQCFDARRCTSVFIKPPPTACQAGGATACAQDLGTGGLAIGDDTVLDALLGHHDSVAASALQRGEIVVFSPAFSHSGKTVLELDRLRSSTGQTQERSVTSYVADVGGSGAAVDGIISRTTAAGLHVTGQPWGYLLDTSRTPTQAEQDTAQADLSQWSTSLTVERGYHPERWNYGLLALAGAAALVTLGATAIATALSAADSRPDLVTLAAVGAAPRLRRRFAAGQAATVAVLGTVLGAVAGLIPAWAVIHAHGHMPWATPWQSIGIVVIGVPIIAATATALLTRSRLPSERRVA